MGDDNDFQSVYIEVIVESDIHSVEEIAAETGIVERQCEARLDSLAAQGQLRVSRTDGEKAYFVPNTEIEKTPITVDSSKYQEAVPEPMIDESDMVSGVRRDTDGTELSPANRDFDFSWRIPTGIEPYVQTDGEYDRVMAMIENRHDTGSMPRFWFSGATGTGKTQMVEAVAQERQDPLFVVEGKYALNEADLVGAIASKGDSGTVWFDSVLPKALQCSQEQETILLFDEIDRVHPKAKGSLFPVLDHRCSVSITQRGGERVSGDPMNLIVFATTNEGDVYVGSNKMDMAERGRFLTKMNFGFLGLSDGKTITNDDGTSEHVSGVELESQVIADRTPVGPVFAEALVETANDVRLQAQQADTSTVRVGIPLRALLSWARSAYTLDQMSGEDNPVVTSFVESVLNVYYDENPTERSTVKTTVVDSSLDGAPVDDEELLDYFSGGMESQFTTKVRCKQCDSTFDYDVLPSSNASGMECPDCAGDLLMES